MTSKKLRKIVKDSGRTVRAAAKELAIHERTLHRFLSGEVPIPRVVALVAECWAKHK